MKKVYIKPALLITKVNCEMLIATSLAIDSDRTATGDNGGWVKRDRSSRDSYNVWNEDWSN